MSTQGPAGSHQPQASSSTPRTKPETTPQPQFAEMRPVPPGAQFVTLSTEDLGNLFARAVRERADRPTTTSKDLKLGDIKPFSSKPEDLEDFLNSIELVVSIKGDIYNNDQKKIAYTLTLMQDGDAGLWRKQYSAEVLIDGDITDTWDEFKTKLRKAFHDAGRKEGSMKWLTTVRQDSRSIEQFNTLFRIHAGRAEIPTGEFITVANSNANLRIPNPQQPILINFYRAAVNPRISNQIVLHGEPNTLNAWMTKATEVASALRRTGQLFTRGIDKRPNRSPFKPRFKQEQQDLTTYYGEPTEVNAIEPKGPSKPFTRRVPDEEIERRKTNGLCIKCGNKGHMANECRKGWSYGKPKEPKQKGKETTPKKKFNPTQLRQHIRSLIDDSFEEGSEDFNAFVQEVEEMGF